MTIQLHLAQALLEERERQVRRAVRARRALSGPAPRPNADQR
jgi:hypothetical protein